MLNLGTPELVVILLVALLVLGPTRLPGAARSVGKTLGEVRRMTSGFQSEMHNAMQEPVAAMRETIGAESRPKRRTPLRAEPEPPSST